uniref:putative uncharacterized protein FLJ46235 n=1 Tax=Callithrix jacchus TaxID=9483 RepID=UPI0023DCF693|nr:putative uncharacterized protein FLJ46235 [Callithrix jacchus]
MAPWGQASASQGALPGPALAFWHPLRVQNIFRSASLGPGPPLGSIYRPNMRIFLAATSVDLAPAQLPMAFVGPKAQTTDSGSPGPPGSCLISGLSELSSCPPRASPGPRHSQVGFCQPGSCCLLLLAMGCPVLGPEFSLSRPSSCPPGVSSWAQNFIRSSFRTHWRLQDHLLSHVCL